MLIAPSLLSLNYDNFNEEIKKLNESADWLHFDVMDGNFVPNISFGPDILRTVRRNTDLFLDVHLMISHPDYFAKIFAEAGADSITFHFENFNDINRCSALIDLIHSYYIKAGISIKPNTNVEAIVPLLNKVDLVLVMSVEPGFGGQMFIPSAIEKIKSLHAIKMKYKLNYLIEVDGGVNNQNIVAINNAGCNVAVAGSFVFKGDIKRNIDLLRNIKVNQK